MALQIRRGTDAERTAGGGVVFADGELVYVTDTDALYIGDASTAGGVLLTNNALSTIGDYLVADTINLQLDLKRDLNLDGGNIIGTGNINIAGTITATGDINLGDDASDDTVNLAAKITSSLTPNADSTFNIGSTTARWNNGYFTGLVVDGQVDAVAVNANVVANDSSVMVNVSNNIFTGAFAGNVTGNVLGDLTGDSAGTHTGAVVGNTTGYHTGDVKGSVFGDDSTPIVDAVNNTLAGNLTGNVTGNVTGDVTGEVKGSGAITVLAANTGPTDAELSVLNVTATGTIAGNVTGNLTGNVTGNAAGDHTGTFSGVITATGTLDGDVTGSVFADNSTLLVDSVAGNIPASVISGTLTNDLTGAVTGNIFTTLIDSADSSAITITPAVVMQADVTIDQSVNIGGLQGVLINDNNIDGYNASNPTKLHINSICADAGDYTEELTIDSNTVFKNDATVEGKMAAFGDRAYSAQYRTQLSETNTGFFVVKYIGDPVDATELQDLANYTIETKITETVADFATAVKFANMTTTVRDALTAEAGMVVFNTTDTKLQVYTGSTWADLH
jgi:hypothetical protein